MLSAGIRAKTTSRDVSAGSFLRDTERDTQRDIERDTQPDIERDTQPDTNEADKGQLQQTH